MRSGATTTSRLVLFGGLYFAQGIPWGFVTSALMIRWTGLGLGPAEVGAIRAAALGPWTWKFLLGPLVDALGRWGRRPLLLACEAGMALTVIALAFADPRQQLGLFLALAFVNSAFVALQDVLTDAVAIALLPAAERGRANGVMSAAKIGGTMMGASGLVLLAGHTGWPACHALAVVLLLLPAVTVLSLDEPPRQRPPALAELLGQIAASFGQRSTLAVGLFVLVAGASDSFLGPYVVAPLRQELHLDNAQMALLGWLGSLTTIAGALGGGWLADRVGRRAAIAIAALALAAAHLTFAAVPRSLPALTAYQIGDGLAGGLLYATTIALCMDLTNPRLAATHFQAMMALFSVRSIWAGLLGGYLAGRTSAPAMFALAAVLELAPLALLPFIARRQALSSDREAQGRRLR